MKNKLFSKRFGTLTQGIVIASFVLNPFGPTFAAINYYTDPGAHTKLDTVSECNNKGKCDVAPFPSNASPLAINETWNVDPLNNTVLTITFSMAELTSKRPDQVAFYTDPSQTYQFDAPFQLTDPMFASLGLLPNAWIDPTDVTHVDITGDVVTLSIHYSYALSKSSSEPANIVKGAGTGSRVWNLYPNPATSQIVLDTRQSAPGDHYQVVNYLGQVMGSGQINSTSNTIDIRDLATGVYILNVFDGDHKSQSIRFVKE